MGSSVPPGSTFCKNDRKYTNPMFWMHKIDGWEFSSFHPDIAVHDDGRLAVFDGEIKLVLPAPAAEIWRDYLYRKYADHD